MPTSALSSSEEILSDFHAKSDIRYSTTICYLNPLLEDFQLTPKRPGITLFSIVRTPTVDASPPRTTGFLSLPESSFSGGASGRFLLQIAAGPFETVSEPLRLKGY
jgi:hypothetical protein